MVTQESMWNAVKDLSDEGKQEVYNFAITLKDSSNVFAPISEEQMKLDLKKSEEQIKQGDFKPYKESLTGMRKLNGVSSVGILPAS